jgi:hypothetical protein
MGPSEDPSTAPQNQGTNQAKTPWRKRRARRPRHRVCLLKGCHRIFRPQHALTRYCSDDCRAQARKWRQWKARHRYRRSEGGKQKRQAQSRRHRLRRKARRAPKTATADGARVITTNFFFWLLRSSWVLRAVPAQPEVAAAAVLFPPLSPGAGTGSGAGEALARTAARPAMKTRPDSPDILRIRLALDSLHLPTGRGRGSGASRTGAVSFSLLLQVRGLRTERWSWNSINSNCVTSG